MTPDYIYNEMTWHEISAAIEFINRYEEPKVQPYKKYKSMSEYLGIYKVQEKTAAVMRRMRK